MEISYICYSWFGQSKTSLPWLSCIRKEVLTLTATLLGLTVMGTSHQSYPEPLYTSQSEQGCVPVTGPCARHFEMPKSKMSDVE